MRCRLCLIHPLSLLAVILLSLTLSGPVAAQRTTTEDSDEDTELIDDIRSGLQTSVGATAAWLDSFLLTTSIVLTTKTPTVALL